MSVLDIIFPKRCVNCKKSGEYICTNCFSHISFATESICTVCNKPSIDGRTHPICKTRYSLDGTFSAVNYKKVVRKLVYQLKYKPYITDLLPTIRELCYEALIQNELFIKVLTGKPVLVPIPLSGNKLRKRGFNQAELLAKELGKRFDLKLLRLLKRTKETKPQYGLKRDERIENMKDAFISKDSFDRLRIKKGLMIKDKFKTILLVDDLLTTGSTMSEAAKILKKSGVEEVWGVAFAKD